MNSPSRLTSSLNLTATWNTFYSRTIPLKVLRWRSRSSLIIYHHHQPQLHLSFKIFLIVFSPMISHSSLFNRASANSKMISRPCPHHLHQLHLHSSPAQKPQIDSLLKSPASLTRFAAKNLAYQLALMSSNSLSPRFRHQMHCLCTCLPALHLHHLQLSLLTTFPLILYLTANSHL